jgi:IclR family transcriptional regulator, acetate operon repressor
MAADSGDASSALLRGLALLEQLARAGRALSLADLADAVALPKPTVHRIARQLAEQGYLVQEPADRRYALAARMHTLALAALRSAAQRAHQHLILQQLVADVGETCNLTLLDGAEVVYIDRVESRWPLQMTLQAGSRVPLHCTASGKLHLALLPARARKRLLASLPLARYTPRTITEIGALETELARIRDARVGTDDQEFIEGLVAAAVPVVDATGQVIAAVAMHGPIGRLSLDRALAAVPRLQRAAQDLAAALAAD